MTHMNVFRTMIAGVIACGLTHQAAGQECAYVGNQLIGTVRILSLPDGAEMGTVTLPDCSLGICQLTELVVNSDSSTAYVSQFDGSRIWIVDTSFATSPEILPFDASPTDLVLDPSGSPLYAISLATAELASIDPDLVRETGRLSLPSQSRGLALAPDGRTIATTSRDQNAVFFIDTSDGSTVQMGATGQQPIDVALSPDGSTAYVANEDGTITEIDVATGATLDTFTVGSLPISISVAPDGNTVYVANRGDDTVSVIDLTADQITDIEVGLTPVATALSSDGLLVVANLQGESLSVIDTRNGNTVLDPIAAGTSPFALAVAPCPGGTTCVGDCNRDGAVAINELITGVNISLGSRPISDCPAFDSNDNGQVAISELIRAVNNSLDGCVA